MPKWTDEPWERQKGESVQAYEAFSLYINMGSKRTVSAVARELQKSRQLLERWKVKWEWKERARLYDNSLEKEAREKAVKDKKSMVDRQIKIAMQVQKKALEALEQLSVEEMSPKDIKEFLKMSTELERLNRFTDVTGGNGEAESSQSLADTIVAAYQKRKEGGELD
jgi:hypothetical protein